MKELLRKSYERYYHLHKMIRKSTSDEVRLYYMGKACEVKLFINELEKVW
jgi:hypothetical protein